MTDENLEDELTTVLEQIADPPVKICRSPGEKQGIRLFHLSTNPLHNHSFIAMIQHYRITRREQELLKTKDPILE